MSLVHGAAVYHCLEIVSHDADFTRFISKCQARRRGISCYPCIHTSRRDYLLFPPPPGILVETLAPGRIEVT